MKVNLWSPSRVLILGALVLLLCTPARAQFWPDGCSIPYSPEWVQRGYDAIFLGACTFHDRCWAACNGPNPPYHGLRWKEGCDAMFWTYMTTACEIAQSRYLDDDFWDFCKAEATAFVTAVNTPPAFDNYWRSQCMRGCNPDACWEAGMQLPWTCGNGNGVGACYVPGGGTGGGGGSTGGGSRCDPDLDGWVTQEECVFECGGWSDGEYCNM